jgi:hypothetical protein
MLIPGSWWIAGTDNEFSLSKSAMLLVRTIIHRVPIYPDSSKKMFPDFASENSLSCPWRSGDE